MVNGLLASCLISRKAFPSISTRRQLSPLYERADPGARVTRVPSSRVYLSTVWLAMSFVVGSWR